MKTFAINEKRSSTAARKTRPYVHHPIGPVQLAQQAEVRRILLSTGAQAKLTIGQPNDKYEQEADRVADQVMRMPDPTLQRQSENEEEEETLQTKPLADQITPLVQRQEEPPREEEEPVQAKFNDGEMIQRMCPGCEENIVQRQPEEEEEEIQTKTKSGHTLTVGPTTNANIQSLKGGGQPLADPVRSFYEPRFGQDFSQVRVHTGSEAAGIAKTVKARAFTLGKDVVFGEGEYKPDMNDGGRLMAHELAHVIQQDTAGKSIQRYTEYDSSDQAANNSLGWKHPASDDIKVSDDGTLVAGDSGDKAWALKTRIVHAERILSSIDSNVKLEEGSGEIKGKAPKKGRAGRKRKLKEVKLVNRAGGGRADLPANCGSAARQILGIGSISEKFSAVTRKNGRGVEKYSTPEDYTDDPLRPAAPTEPWVEDVLKNELGAATADEARRRYEALPETDPKRKKIDRKYGLNKYAVPRVGQAITAHKASGWNFHFAGAILKGGHDYVTAENYPGAGHTSQSWWFDMYGPRSKGQTFYQTWTGGPSTVAMVVESEKARKGKTNRAGVYLVRNPSKWKSTKRGVLSSGTHVDVIGRGWKWRKVEVKSGVHTGKVGWIMSKFYKLR